MTLLSWARKLFTRPSSRTIRKELPRYRLSLLKLEDRIVPSSYSPGGQGVAATQPLSVPLTMDPTERADDRAWREEANSKTPSVTAS